jgi:hypothetical protein
MVAVRMGRGRWDGISGWERRVAGGSGEVVVGEAVVEVEELGVLGIDAVLRGLAVLGLAGGVLNAVAADFELDERARRCPLWTVRCARGRGVDIVRDGVVKVRNEAANGSVGGAFLFVQMRHMVPSFDVFFMLGG